MKNKILTHKFLPIIAVFMLVTSTLCTSCFASSDTLVVNYNNTVYNLPSIDSYISGSYSVGIIVFYDNEFVLITSYDQAVSSTNSGVYYPKFNNSLSVSKCKRYKLVNDSWQFYDSFTSEINFSKYTLDTLVYTTKDIKNGSSGELVFQQPQEEGGIIAPLTKSIDFSVTLKEILAIFPLVLVILIGLLSLRKAIALMFQTFRAS